MPGHRPTLAEFRERARRATVVPVWREILADADTPLTAYARLAGEPCAFLLESVTGGENWARYSFAGASPHAVVRAHAGRVETRWRDGRVEVRAAADPTAPIADLLARFRAEPDPELPRFFGGLVGWLSYDLVRAFERLPATAPDALGLPDLVLALTDVVIAFDNVRGSARVIACALVEDGADAPRAWHDACGRVDAAIERLRAPAPPLPTLPLPAEAHPAEAVSNFAPEAFRDAVRRAREHVLCGDVVQAVIAQRWSAPAGGATPLSLYRALRALNPSPYLYLLDWPEARVIGSSPEALARLEGGAIETRPIAGTRARGGDPEEDARLRAELLADPKERAEHVMLVDLARNDLGRVAETGSVRVADLMAVERYSHVMHIVSQVGARLRAGCGPLDLVRAAFPAGTLTGAPKVRAMEIIESLEPSRRGPYGGAVGYLSYTGNLDLAIHIRTLLVAGGRIHAQAGAGIVADSDPDAEYQETLHKARPLLLAIGMAREAGG